jgi:hypothetical protein
MGKSCFPRGVRAARSGWSRESSGCGGRSCPFKEIAPACRIQRVAQSSRAAAKIDTLPSPPRGRACPTFFAGHGGCIRARLQPCRPKANRMAALAAAAGGQGLKPRPKTQLPSARLKPCPVLKISAGPPHPALRAALSPRGGEGKVSRWFGRGSAALRYPLLFSFPPSP